jgi:hypothetical protein
MPVNSYFQCRSRSEAGKNVKCVKKSEMSVADSPRKNTCPFQNYLFVLRRARIKIGHHDPTQICNQNFGVFVFGARKNNSWIRDNNTEFQEGLDGRFSDKLRFYFFGGGGNRFRSRLDKFFCLCEFQEILDNLQGSVIFKTRKCNFHLQNIPVLQC